MPVKAKAQVKTKAGPKAAKTSVTANDVKESNRLRQQRFLEKHRDEINEKRREKYLELKESGRCPRCGKKLRSRKSILCKDCLEKAREYNSQK